MTTHPCCLLQYARHALLRIDNLVEGWEMSTERGLLVGAEQSRAAVCARVVCLLPCLWRMASLGCTWRTASLVWLLLPFGLAWATAAESGKHQTCK